MARSEAQKAADKKYRENHKGVLITWATKFKPSEVEEIDAVIKQSGMSKAEFTVGQLLNMRKTIQTKTINVN